MRVAVVGAGGTGGYFGARLGAGGHDVGFIARGARLASLRRNGLTVHSVAGDVVLPTVRATDDPTEVGAVDAVLLCVKTWQLPEALGALPPLLDERTPVVTMQNGVEAPAQVAAALGQDHVIPGVARVFAFIDGPASVRHIGGLNELVFAEWDNQASPRTGRLREALIKSGVSAPVREDIWAELWAKFLLIVPFGALGAATGLPLGVLRSRIGTRRLLAEAMREIETIARATGVALPHDVVSAKMAFLDQQPAEATTSLQRDLSAGARSELEAWAGAVVRLGAQADVPTRVHSVLYELLSAREQA